MTTMRCGARSIRSGTGAARRYRDLGRLYGKPNPIFIRWLNHPSYDRYWQEMIPYREQFAQHQHSGADDNRLLRRQRTGRVVLFHPAPRYNPHADHTLIIGPYDDSVMQRGPQAVLQGYEIDSAALVDLHELRYQWFDHVFKGAVLPALVEGPRQLRSHGSERVAARRIARYHGQDAAAILFGRQPVRATRIGSRSARVHIRRPCGRP